MIDVCIGRFSDTDRANFDEPSGFLSISYTSWSQAEGDLMLIFLLGRVEQK